MNHNLLGPEGDAREEYARASRGLEGLRRADDCHADACGGQ